MVAMDVEAEAVQMLAWLERQRLPDGRLPMPQAAMVHSAVENAYDYAEAMRILASN